MRLKIQAVILVLALASAVIAQDVPKADLFFGYSFLRANSAQNIPAFTANGGVGTFAWNFNQFIAFESELGGYHNGNVNNHQFDTTTFSYLFGPRFSLGRSKTFDPYVHALFGGMDAHTSICCLVPTTGTGQTSGTGDRLAKDQNNFAMAFGGGIDIKLSRTVVLRPIQLDYFMTRYQAPDISNLNGPSTNRNQHDLRYAAGIAFNFGGERPGPPPPPPPPPPSLKSCPGGTSVPIDQACPKQNIGLNIRPNPSEVCPGELSNVAPTINLPEGVTPQWSINGEATSQAPVFQFGSTGRNPGSYRIGLIVRGDAFNDATAETTVRVRDYTPPSGTLNINPPEIWAGDRASLSPSFTPGQCGGPLGDVAYSTPEGIVSGNEFDSTTVRFDPADSSEQRKTITITAKASDQKGSGTATGSLVVKQRAAVTAHRLPDILFPAKSERVNNCGKRVLLEELKALFEADPGGKVIFVGHVAEGESTSGNLDLKRALNAAAVISSGQGICSQFPPAQILAAQAGTTDNGVSFQPHFCGISTNVQERRGQDVEQSDASAKYRRVEVWFVPTGGVVPASAKDGKDAVTLGVGSLGCPK
jgi:opacity protein-like surface antigen